MQTFFFKENAKFVFNVGYQPKGESISQKIQNNNNKKSVPWLLCLCLLSVCIWLFISESVWTTFFFKLFFVLCSLLVWELSAFCTIYISIYKYILMCFFLIAGSLDLVLSKTMTKKSYELFSATFPHSLFKCGTTSAAESPQPHPSHKPSLTTNHTHHGRCGEDGWCPSDSTLPIEGSNKWPSQVAPYTTLSFSHIGRSLTPSPNSRWGCVAADEVFQLECVNLVSLFLLWTFWSVL